MVDMIKANKLTEGSNVMWESSRMMLPEHVQAIHEWQVEGSKDVKPLVDEQQLEQFTQLIHEARENHLNVQIKIWKNGYFYTKKGIIHDMDQQLQTLRLIMEEELGMKNIKIDAIIDIEIL